MPAWILPCSHLDDNGLNLWTCKPAPIKCPYKSCLGRKKIHLKSIPILNSGGDPSTSAWLLCPFFFQYQGRKSKWINIGSGHWKWNWEVYWLVFVSIWHRLELSQRKELQLGKCLHEIQLWDIFSISDQGSLVGGIISGLVVLGSIREQAEQSRWSKPVRNISPWPLHQLLLPDLLQFQSFLQWWTAVWKCKPNKPLPPQLGSWSWCLCRNRNPN